MRETGYDNVTDEDLVLASLMGDLEAFDELVRRFRGAVVLVAEQALGGRTAAAVAEDVAQEAFLLAFKALPQLDEPAKFAGWLYAITRNRARRVGLGERRSEATEPSEIDRLLTEHSRELGNEPGRALIRQIEAEALHAALDLLPDEYRTVLHLRYFEDWPLARIADFLLLPLSTVKWRLHYGRDLLRRRLTKPPGGPFNDRIQRHGAERNGGRRPADGDTAAAPPPPRNSRPRAPRQPYGQPARGRPQCRAAL